LRNEMEELDRISEKIRGLSVKIEEMQRNMEKLFMMLKNAVQEKSR